MIRRVKAFGFKELAVVIALTVNTFFLCVLYDVLPSYTSSSWQQVPIAYNFYKHGTLAQMEERIVYKTQKAVPLGLYDAPEKPSVNDTVGYGFLVGSIWKITNSLDLIDVQILQILLFCLTIFLMYGMALLLFQSSSIAFIGSLLVTFWYHLVLMNVIPARDIWGYYGGVVLTYVFLKFFLFKTYSYRKVFLGAAFFGFCQFLRPNIVGQCATLCAALLLLFYFYKRKELQRGIRVVGLVVLANVLFFWVPFISFNKIVYDRYFVGPVGHGLLASLGTVDNPWGLKCDDLVVVEYIKKNNSSVIVDSVTQDEAGVTKFLRLLKEHPFVYMSAVIKSVKSALFFEVEAVYNFFYKCFSDDAFFMTKVNEALCLNPGLFILKILEHFSSKVLRIIGYCGLLLVLYRRQFISPLFLIGGVFFGMWVLLLSHFEEHYVVPFAWPFALFAGYFLVVTWQWAFVKSQSTHTKARIGGGPR